MTAQIITFPNAPAEPPVDLNETLARAQRRHCLGLLSEVFGAEYSRALSVLHEAQTREERDSALARLEEWG